MSTTENDAPLSPSDGFKNAALSSSRLFSYYNDTIKDLPPVALQSYAALLTLLLTHLETTFQPGLIRQTSKNLYTLIEAGLSLRIEQATDEGLTNARVETLRKGLGTLTGLQNLLEGFFEQLPSGTDPKIEEPPLVWPLTAAPTPVFEQLLIFGCVSEFDGEDGAPDYAALLARHSAAPSADTFEQLRLLHITAMRRLFMDSDHADRYPRAIAAWAETLVHKAVRLYSVSDDLFTH